MKKAEASSSYWCHICYERVNPIPYNGSVKCPICEGEFLEEMATAASLRSVNLLLKGSYLSTPRTEKISEDGEDGRLRYGLSSMQGWRLAMEDAHAALSNLDGSTSFFGVYDGHGGKEVANFCSKFLHGEVLNHEAYKAGDLGTSVRSAFLRMDEMMCGETGWRELALLRGKEDLYESDQDNGLEDNWPSESEGIHSDYEGPSSGTTACVAVIQNNILLVANAGDSRCVISRKRQFKFLYCPRSLDVLSSAQDLSNDHKPDLDVEKNRITEAGGYVENGRVNGRLNLSRAVCDMQLKQNKSLPAEKQIVTANPDIISVKLSEADDFLVIASDGIWNCMSSQEAVDFIQEHMKTEKKLSVVCEKVLDRCLSPTSEGEGCDNMTMILVQFKKP